MAIRKMTYLKLLTCLWFGCTTYTHKENDSANEHSVVVNKSVENPNQENVERLKLLNANILIDFPTGFNIMSEEMLAAKYPAKNRPTLVYTNEDGSVNFAFKHC